MTIREASIITAYTGYVCGSSFNDFHEYVEELLGRIVWTHEFADEAVVLEIKEKSTSDFISLEVV